MSAPIVPGPTNDPTNDRAVDLASASTTATALALYDDLPAVGVDELLGRWAGREHPTGHPMDGLLESSGWWGKQFDSADEVHPLLFDDGRGGQFAVDPRLVPIGLAPRLPGVVVSRGRRIMATLRPVVGTRRHRARLRAVEHRGVVSAAMVYDHLPIVDHFRRLDADTVLGCMDLRDQAPYFFVLSRA